MTRPAYDPAITAGDEPTPYVPWPLYAIYCDQCRKWVEIYPQPHVSECDCGHKYEVGS